MEVVARVVGRESLDAVFPRVFAMDFLLDGRYRADGVDHRPSPDLEHVERRTGPNFHRLLLFFLRRFLDLAAVDAGIAEINF